jgi:hypothetical protein
MQVANDKANLVRREASQSSINSICEHVAKEDFIYLTGNDVRGIINNSDDLSVDDLSNYQQSWNHLNLDNFMADNGKYRYRRHATLSGNAGAGYWRQEKHQPHYQAVEYNGVNGGIERHYDPIDTSVLFGSTMASLISLGTSLASHLSPYCKWKIEVHQFRISADQGAVGKPTPEGVHRDGVNYVLMSMVNSQNLKGGVSTIYDLNKTPLSSYTFTHPLEVAFVNDERVYHGVTPIEPLISDSPAVRDLLVVTYKRQK